MPLLGPLWVLQLRKYHIMSGNDCWNTVCFSCCRKVVNELADVTLSGSKMFQNCAAATGNARPPMVDSLNGGIRRRFDPAERSAGRPDTSAACTNELSSMVSLRAGLCMSEQPFCTVSVLEPVTSADR